VLSPHPPTAPAPVFSAFFLISDADKALLPPGSDADHPAYEAGFPLEEAGCYRPTFSLGSLGGVTIFSPLVSARGKSGFFRQRR